MAEVKPYTISKQVVWELHFLRKPIYDIGEGYC